MQRSCGLAHGLGVCMRMCMCRFAASVGDIDAAAMTIANAMVAADLLSMDVLSMDLAPNFVKNFSDCCICS